MKTLKTASQLIAILALPVLLPAAGGNNNKTKVAAVRSFVPPSPIPVAETALIEGPGFDASLFAKELPLLFSAAAPAGARNIEGEIRLRKAEEHYKKGRELAAKGELVAARAEFDAAIEQLAGASPIMPERARLMARYQTLLDEIYALESQPGSGKAMAAAPANEGEETATAAAVPTTQEPPPGFDRAPVEQVAESTFSIEPALRGQVLDQVRSTVSQLRLEVEDPVVGFINFYTTPSGHEIVKAGLKRAGRYAPMIRRILDEEGLPPEMIYLAQAESGFMPRAVSWASAVGMWQFIQSRGREYKLMQTPYTDDRLDPEKATRAAARHLRDLYHQFGDWYLAVAAYNCGPYNVERGVQRTGYADFWELYKRNVLPRETANYLPIILALTIMSKNPKAYGLDGITPDAPYEYDTITLAADTHLELIADLAEKPLALIKELNPAVLRFVAPAGYQVHVPKGAGQTVLSRLEFVPAGKRTTWRVRRLESGETVASVAAQFRMSEELIAQANRQPSGGDSTSDWAPEPGDFVVVPSAYAGAAMAAPVVARSTRGVTRRGGRVTVAASGKKKPAAVPARKGAMVASSAKQPAKQPAKKAVLARR